MKPILPTRFLSVLAVAAVLISSFSVSSSAFAFSGTDTTKDLKTAVEKLNYWLNGSDQREGWRRFLLLNELETQTGLGNQADLGVLQNIQSRFHGSTSGLEHQVFQGVKNAIDHQIQRLVASRQKSIPLLLADAKHSYAAPSVELLEQKRDQAIADINALIRNYRSTMPSRKRALLFYDLQLDPMKEYLQNLQIELAPEVSVSKLDSMIRGVQEEIDVVVEKIDAMPIIPGPDEDDSDEDDSEEQRPTEPGPDNGDDALNLSPRNEDLAALILSGNGPSEDQSEKTLEELEKQQELLEAKKDTLNKRRKTIRKADLPRLRARRDAVIQLRKYEQVFDEYADQQGDPYFVIAASSFAEFSNSYLHGTSGNLQEEMLNRLADVGENLTEINDPDEARTASGLLGDSLRWLDDADQLPALVTAIRTRYSYPNAYLSIDGSLLNELASQTVSDRAPVRQNTFGRLVRGCSETNGNVTVQLIDDPNQIRARLRLDATVASGVFIQQGKVQVYTDSYGSIAAERDVYAARGGVHWSDVGIAANFSSVFAGTNSKYNLVNRIAENAFNKSKARADQNTEQQAKERGLEGFDEQTTKPLVEANERLLELQKEALQKANKLPSIYLNSMNQRVNVVIKQESESTLAAPNLPASFGVNPEVKLRIHDTLASNYLDPLFSGKTFTNEELADQISEITGEAPPGLTGEDEDGEPVEPFSIGFTRVRPIQVEFDGQKIRVVVSGRKFAQGDQEINAGMKIIITFKVQNDNGQLKFGRDGKVEFEYLDPERTTPALVAFRRVLDENLNKNLDTEDTQTDLPANFIPIKQVPELEDSPVANKLRLVQFRSDQGWLYLGWNYESNPGEAMSWIYDLPAIWKQ